METTEIAEIFRNRLEPELISEIEAGSKIIHLKENEILIDRGEYVTAMPIVLRGTLKVSRVDEDGKEILLYYLGAGDTCAMTFTCCMMQHQSEVRAVAEEDCELLIIPIQKMDEWLVKYTTWKSFVMQSIRLRFNELLASIEKIAFHKLDERLVSYLKEKEKATGSSVIRATHQEIADDLGSSRVVISRLLKQLENDRKVVLYRNEIKLLRAL